MGLRAIPAARLLAAHVTGLNAVFTYPGLQAEGEEALNLDPIVVLSSAMYLPAVVAQAEAIAAFCLPAGGSDVLGIKRTVNDMGVLGVECDVGAIDGSAQGILRSALLVQACEQVFGLKADAQGKPQVPQRVDLARVTAYYRGEGAAAVRGERADILMGEIPSINRE